MKDSVRQPGSQPRQRRAHVVVAGVVVFLGLLLGPHTGTLAADRPAPSEYQIKAAFLLNFVQFVEWPTAAFPNAEAPIVVGILGDDPFGPTLEQTFQGQSPHGRSLTVRRSRQVEDLLDCHLLFVCRSEKDRVGQILASMSNRPCLTVGEVDNFALRGGVINFYLEEKKVRFELNVDAAERAELRVHSQLLKRAKIVGRTPTRRGSQG